MRSNETCGALCADRNDYNASQTKQKPWEGRAKPTVDLVLLGRGQLDPRALGAVPEGPFLPVYLSRSPRPYAGRPRKYGFAVAGRLR